MRDGYVLNTQKISFRTLITNLIKFKNNLEKYKSIIRNERTFLNIHQPYLKYEDITFKTDTSKKEYNNLYSIDLHSYVNNINEKDILILTHKLLKDLKIENSYPQYYNFSLHTDYKDQTMLKLFPSTYENNKFLLIDKGCEEFNKENLLSAIVLFLKYRSLSSPTDLKLFKEGFFKKLTNKKFNELLVILEEDGEIEVERTPKLLVKQIILKDKTKRDSKNQKLLQKLKSTGKLKSLSSDHEKNYYKLERLELYKLRLFPHLKTNIVFKEDSFYLEINYFSMKYAKSIMNDMGVWQDFKNSLKEKLNKKIKEIESYLEIEINTEITSLIYEERSHGEGYFLTKELDLIIK